MSDDVAWTSLSISPQHQHSSHAVMLALHSGSCNTLQCRTKCKKLTLHSKNVLPELVHTVSRSKLGVSDRAVACGRSSHLPVDEFQMKVCHKVIAFK